MGTRFYCFPLIVSGGLLGILAAPSAEIKTTECEINKSEPQLLSSLPVCSGLVYQKDTCHCHMDQCLEAVRYNHIEKCGTTTLPKVTPPPPSDDGEGSGGGDSTEGSGSGDTSMEVNPSEYILALSEEELLFIYAEMFNHTLTTTTTTTTTTTENINSLVINSGLTKPVVVKVAQFGVGIAGDAFHLCNCKEELPELLEFKVVLKNIFWNPLLADPRTSVSRELKSAIEQELQLLIASSDIKISSGRLDNRAKYPIELEVLYFTEFQGFTQTSALINITESHFDNDLIFETKFATLIERYDNYQEPDIFGKTFKRYTKHIFSPKLNLVRRRLPETVNIKVVVVENEDGFEDPIEPYSIFGLPVAGLSLILAIFCCLRACHCKHWC